MISTLKEVREALVVADNIATLGSAYSVKAIETGFNKLQSAITKLDALIAQAEKAEPVAYRSRMRPLWGTRNFTEWSLCSKALYDDYKRAPMFNDWEYQAEALYTAPQSAAEPLTWLPIETAPKDGTVFLGLHGNKVREAYRVQRDDCEMWCFGGSSGDVEIAPYTKPTHWMPLPDAPDHGIGAKA